MERRIGSPLTVRIIELCKINVNTLALADYTPDVVSQIVNVIVGYYSNYNSITNTLAKFRRCLKDMGATEEVLAGTYNLGQTDKLKQAEEDEKIIIKKASPTLPMELWSINQLKSRVKEFNVSPDGSVTYPDAYIIVDLHILTAFPADPINKLIISEYNNVIGKLKSNLAENPDEVKFNSPIDDAEIRDYIQNFMKKTVKFRREKFDKFNTFLQNREITANHINDLSFKLNEKINMLQDDEARLTHIYKQAAKISASDPEYMRPLSAPNDVLKMAIDELDAETLAKVRAIVSAATGFDL
jgi:hypothetical protein